MSNGNARKEVAAKEKLGHWSWEPMSDKKNGLRRCKGTKVKNFVKDVMEIQSCGVWFYFKFGFKVETIGLRRQPV